MTTRLVVGYKDHIVWKGEDLFLFNFGERGWNRGEKYEMTAVGEGIKKLDISSKNGWKTQDLKRRKK
jgi:hypothetical protein